MHRIINKIHDWLNTVPEWAEPIAGLLIVGVGLVVLSPLLLLILLGTALFDLAKGITDINNRDDY